MLNKIIAPMPPVRLATTWLKSFFYKKYVRIANVIDMGFCVLLPNDKLRILAASHHHTRSFLRRQ